MLILILILSVFIIYCFSKFYRKNNIENFTLYTMEKCDPYYQPCNAAKYWFYYDGYMYPSSF